MKQKFFFETAVSSPKVAFDNSCTPISILEAQKSQPVFISPRIGNEKLRKSLTKRCSCGIKFTASPCSKAPNHITRQSTPVSVHEQQKHKKRQPSISPESQQALDDIESLCDDELVLKKIIAELRRLLTFYTKSQDYVNATHVKTTIDAVSAKIHRLNESKNGDEDIKRLKGRHKELEELVNSMLDEWQEQYDGYVESVHAEIENIQRKQAKKLEEFDAKAPDNVNMKFYRRTQEVMDMKTEEKRYVLLQDFQSAEKAKKKKEMLELNELDRAAELTQKDFVKRRNKLLEEQRQQLDKFIQYSEGVMRSMIAERNKVVAPYLRRMNRIDDDLDKLHVDSEEPMELDPKRWETVKQTQDVGPFPRFRRMTNRKDRQEKGEQESPPPPEPEAQEEEEQEKESEPEQAAEEEQLPALNIADVLPPDTKADENE